VEKKFYSIDELKNATIIDSEGLLYGYVEDITIEESNAKLVAYTLFKINEPAINVEKLKSILSSRISLEGNEPLETLVALARKENIEIPWQVTEKEVKWIKGYVPLSEVVLIDSKQLFIDDTRTHIKIVLLSTPREAIFRGLPVNPKSQTYRPQHVIGKLVISASRGILGIAKEIVVSPGMLGFRVYRVRSRKKVVNWIAFTTHVKRMGLKEAYEKLVEFRDPYKYSKVDLSLTNEIEQLLEGTKEKEKILGAMQNYIETEEAGTEYVDIPYSEIVRVGEFVISR
jgi:sporulation protein YlmC with PRC-barrel domain